MLRSLLLTGVVVISGCATGSNARREATLEQWADNHPEASKDLGLWVREHSKSAALFFDWDGHHIEQSQEFVTWAIVHKEEPLEAFTTRHPGWQRFDKIMEGHRPAAEAFMGWCRRHPEAAEELMHHPGGLDWAGHHLYAADWHLENG